MKEVIGQTAEKQSTLTATKTHIEQVWQVIDYTQFNKVILQKEKKKKKKLWPKQWETDCLESTDAGKC